MSVLEEIVRGKRVEVERLSSHRTALRSAAESAPMTRSFASVLQRRGEVAVIAEMKRRSPSAGWLWADARAEEIGAAYEAAGASAVSVLTEAQHFGGSLADLRAVRERIGLPVLRKDFLIDELQLWESRAAGADAVLLIVRILELERLQALLALARELGLAALVEVHSRGELECALAAEADIVGVNSRDLDTLRMDVTLALELAPEVPAERVLVAESGIREAADVDRLGEAGVNAVLVGEALMRARALRGAMAATAALCGRRRRERTAAGFGVPASTRVAPSTGEAQAPSGGRACPK
ncbi:MAG: indole-3-glycerol phosphate synthase TrpC [Gemmatimonadetes bacterium]|nr:indole-3-glycerol phosphate synthase TrpC [Gemmatimonadota bacterium]